MFHNKAPLEHYYLLAGEKFQPLLSLSKARVGGRFIGFKEKCKFLVDLQLVGMIN